MPLLMIGNPRPKSKKRKVRVRTRAGVRTMTAKQAKYFAPRRGRGTVEKVILSENPRRKSVAKKVRRRKARKATTTRRRTRRTFARNPIRRSMRRRARTGGVRRRRFRRNPIPRSIGGFLNNSLMPAAVGAAGAIGVDILLGNLLPSMPATLQQPNVLPFLRIGSALAVGLLVGMVSPSAGAQAAAGGMIVTVYQLAKSWLASNAPNVRMARYVPMNRYVKRRLGIVRRGPRRARNNILPITNRFASMKGNPVTRSRQGRIGYLQPARLLTNNGMARYVQRGGF